MSEEAGDRYRWLKNLKHFSPYTGFHEYECNWCKGHGAFDEYSTNADLREWIEHHFNRNCLHNDNAAPEPPDTALANE